MGTRSRSVVVAAVIAVGALVAVGLAVPAAQARASAKVPRVSGLAAAGSNLAAARLAVKWKRVKGATYQVRFGTSAASLAKAPLIATRATAAWSQVLGSTCPTWYAQVRAKKKGRFGAWSAKKALKFANKPTSGAGLAGANFTGTPVTNGVRFTWNAVPNATRYRVEWDAAPSGKFTPTVQEFVGKSPYWTTQRSVTLTFGSVPTAGDRMMGTAYGNPVYARLIANNACYPSNLPTTQFVALKPVFPGGPGPAAGDPVRFGTYNLEKSPELSKVAEDGPARMAAFAENIDEHNLDVLVLQESTATTAGDLISELSGRGEADWSVVDPGTPSAQQILYRSSAYEIADGGSATGTFGQAGPPNASVPLPTPWVRLHPTTPDVTNVHQDFLVVAPHLSQDEDGRLDSDTTQFDPVEQKLNKKNAGIASTTILSGIDAVNPADVPVLVAGDLRYLREPFQDVAGEVEGPPTFVRGLTAGRGFYDALNSVMPPKGIGYTTVNGHRDQVLVPGGAASRADYILARGTGRSVFYENVANEKFPSVSWTNGLSGPDIRSYFPSDHNLVYADLVIPYG